MTEPMSAQQGARAAPPGLVPGRFAGKTAIVTGAGSGIGHATAVRLALEGARVIAGDVAKDRLDQLVDDVRALDPDAAGRVVPVGGDITDQSAVEALVGVAGARIDALANVAGIMDGFLPAAEVDDATWERVLAVNLTAVMRLTRAVLPVMIEGGGGAIVNVSSEASLRGSCSGIAYAASKHALNGLTRSTAVCYRGQGIRVNAIAPGPVATAIEAPFRSEHAAAVLGPLLATQVPPVASPHEQAAMIAWLLGDEASNVNGAVIPVDGGWCAV